jgi:hypothetical protein
MCGHSVLVRPDVKIRKSPEEELARIEILSSLAREGSGGRRFSVAVSGLTSFVERGCEGAVRERAIMELMNLLLGDPKYASDGTLRVIVRAMGDADGEVRDTAECAAMVLAKDFASRAFPILLQEMDGADEETSEKMLSTISIICKLATPKEREKLNWIVMKHNSEMRRVGPSKEIARPKSPKRAAPISKLKVA